MIDILGRWNYSLKHYNISTDYFMDLEWASSVARAYKKAYNKQH